jgi:aryl-alcohol dehydrogenase-like predicted oxidoreductase
VLPIPGTSSLEHLDENVAASAIALTVTERATLDDLGAVRTVR